MPTKKTKLAFFAIFRWVRTQYRVPGRRMRIRQYGHAVHLFLGHLLFKGHHPGGLSLRDFLLFCFFAIFRWIRTQYHVPGRRMPVRQTKPRSAPLPRPPSIHRGDIQGVCRCETFLLFLRLFLPDSNQHRVLGIRVGVTSLPLRSD